MLAGTQIEGREQYGQGPIHAPEIARYAKTTILQTKEDLSEGRFEHSVKIEDGQSFSGISLVSYVNSAESRKDRGKTEKYQEIYIFKFLQAKVVLIFNYVQQKLSKEISNQLNQVIAIYGAYIGRKANHPSPRILRIETKTIFLVHFL